MMNPRKTLTTLGVSALLPILVACGATTESSGSGSDSGSSETVAAAEAGSSDSSSSDSSSEAQVPAGGGSGGPGGGVDVSAVSSEQELIDMVQSAYGDAGLGLHRGHQPVESTLIEVLGISHEEMHVRMEEQGQNLAAIANDVGVGDDTLIEALVDSWSPAIDSLEDSGEITEAEAEQYRDALTEAFTFRVTWDGEEATPTFTGLDA